MTAVVGILNKQAVAIAADSAVTIGGTNGRKIFNKANKVFALSKVHPVGIMIYNSASFMTTPWETIIKIYRKQLGDQSFAKLQDYQQDFLNFLKEKQFFTEPDIQIAFLINFAELILREIIDKVATEIGELSGDDESKNLLLSTIQFEFEQLISKISSNPEYCPDFNDYTFEQFGGYSKDTINALLKKYFESNGLFTSELFNQKFLEAVFYVLKTQETNTNYTGLIFTGFGEDEIYPQLVPVNISMVVDNRLRYFIDEERSASISNTQRGQVCPFAQTDVIDTILSGVDPNLDEIYRENFSTVFAKYNEELLKIIDGSNPELSTQIRALDVQPIIDQYVEMNAQIRRAKYIQPLMNAVTTLSKEDLAEMAESLIYLTYLKRRITFAEESVGGPVDVAIISKGDGFVWIKRKHYFAPELNKHFFDNYFKK